MLSINNMIEISISSRIFTIYYHFQVKKYLIFGKIGSFLTLKIPEIPPPKYRFSVLISIPEYWYQVSVLEALVTTSRKASSFKKAHCLKDIEFFSLKFKGFMKGVLCVYVRLYKSSVTQPFKTKPKKIVKNEKQQTKSLAGSK